VNIRTQHTIGVIRSEVEDGLYGNASRREHDVSMQAEFFMSLVEGSINLTGELELGDKVIVIHGTIQTTIIFHCM
jgi:hypothetical protein